MAAEGEEVVVGAEAVVAQEAGPDAGDLVLGGGRGRRDGGSGLVEFGGLGGEGLAVELAACGEGETGGVSDSGGDGGGREALGEPGPDRCGVGRRAAVGDEVGGELVASRRAVRGDGGGGDPRVGPQRGFDFLGFDALAQDLDLVVVTAMEFEQAVAGVTGEVAAAVQAAAWRSPGVGDERGGGLDGAVQVAVADTWAGDAQLAGGAGGTGRCRSSRIRMTALP